MNWTQQGNRHESDAGYVIICSGRPRGLVYNAWLEGPPRLHIEQSIDLERCKRACEENFALDSPR